MTRCALRAPFALLALLAGGAVLTAAACGGGGDDIKNIQATATAAAKNRPSPTATPDPVAAYRQKATDGGKALTTAAAKLSTDMLAAADNQADPKWPNTLNADADAVSSAAGDLKRLTAPSDAYADFGKKLTDAATQLEKAASLLKQAIPAASQDLGAQAFQNLDEGQTKLKDALAALPAQ